MLRSCFASIERLSGAVFSHGWCGRAVCSCVQVTTQTFGKAGEEGKSGVETAVTPFLYVHRLRTGASKRPQRPLPMWLPDAGNQSSSVGCLDSLKLRGIVLDWRILFPFG